MKDSDWEILYELHKNPNMTKVANLLYMTQPSLTKRIQHMEEEFQIQIVNRTPKGLEFTREGDFLAEKAEEYLKFLKKTREELKGMKEKSKGEIVIGSSYTFSKYSLSDLLLAYRRDHPNINFSIINEQSNVLFRKMLDESIDVGFIRGDYEGVVNRRLIGKDAAYLVTKEPVTFEELPSMQYLGYKTNDRTMELLHAWWEERFENEFPSGMVVGYVDVAWQLIARGVGYTICFLPAHFENEHHLCLTPLETQDGRPVTRNTWFLYSKNKRLSPHLEEFVTYVEKEISEKNKEKHEGN